MARRCRKLLNSWTWPKRRFGTTSTPSSCRRPTVCVTNRRPGAPPVEYAGTPAAIRRHKALALLAYLAVAGQPQRRDALATLLWPESAQASARQALRRDLSELNVALGGQWLEADRESIALRPGFWLDVNQFQRYLDECAATSGVGAAFAAFALVVQAFDQAAGDVVIAVVQHGVAPVA